MKLKKSEKFAGVSGPVLTVVMDGVGVGSDNPGNAVRLAHMPTLNRLKEEYPTLLLKAHGTAVGLMSDDDMGNSEVGHNALGAGQVFSQGAKLVSESIANKKIFGSKVWKELCENAGTEHTFHFIGLFSDGNVHSHIDHLKALISRAREDGVRRCRIHILLDGRDVGETSALEYIIPFEQFLDGLRGENFDVKIASGGGRMKITMDRYEANWNMVALGWKTHVEGEGRYFDSAEEAVRTLREETHAIDQDLDPFVIAEDGVPVGRISDGDSVVFFNFRGDRAIEISRAFEDEDLGKFERKTFPKVLYAGMLQYDGDTNVPSRYLVDPPEITNTMGEYLADSGVSQYAVSETQKYGHVTYFWNGNRSGKFSEELEVYEKVDSDTVPFEQRPWMKCAEITDKVIEAIKSGKYKFIRCNFPNGDMVGHTGSLRATRVSMEALDLCLERILPVIDAAGGVALITADHGNAEEMYEMKKGKLVTNGDGSYKAKTSHTLNPVPFIFYDNKYRDRYEVKTSGSFGLSDVAATVVNFLGYEAPGMWDESMIEIK